MRESRERKRDNFLEREGSEPDCQIYIFSLSLSLSLSQVFDFHELCFSDFSVGFVQ
ncbi:hypothetical protein Sjap_011842 [Stephania japonica]|uniref:Uncharacterized protein n=1 Tax=Stephania japonica TaxID=461633 RepID=A0AAP0JE54_9MAGN